MRDSYLPVVFLTLCMALTEESAAALREDPILVVLSHRYRALAEAGPLPLHGAQSALYPFDISADRLVAKPWGLSRKAGLQ